jgi:hypothetical protein
VRVKHAAVVALTVLVAAGCGAAPKTYHVDGTATCLRDTGYRVRTDAANMGVVAAAAPLGSVRAFETGNVVTISFGGDHREAINISKLYRKFAPKKLRPHIDDVMEIDKNAVLLWTVTPPIEEHDKVIGCLKG